MFEKLAKLLSVILHPLFMPSFGIALLFSFNSLYGFFPAQYKWFIFLIVWVFTLIIPLVSFWVLKRTGQISDYNIRQRKERVVPMILTLSCYISAYILLYRFNVPQVVLRFILGGVIALIIAGVITTFWKISAHLSGIGGFTGALFMLSLVLNQNLSLLVGGLFVLAGILAWARLYLKVHTLMQVTAGFALGFLVMVAVFWTIA